MDLNEFKKKMWYIVGKEGIEITNQNIDWLISRAENECVLEEALVSGTPIKIYDCVTSKGIVSVLNIIYRGKVYFVVKTDFTINIIEELPNVYVRGNEYEQ